MDGPTLSKAMSLAHWRAAAVAAAIAAVPLAPTVRPQDADPGVRVDFAGEWTKRWKTAELASRVNRFTVLGRKASRFLMIQSERSASALYHPIERATRSAGRVSWRWKIDRVLNGAEPERTRRGDDYAARFFVVFDGQPFSRKARAICYVWAATEPIGSVYRNPYFSEVVTIVLESGNEKSGNWVLEERDFLADYKATFGSAPESVSAIAVMVDTDDTRGRATAWFDEIIVRPPATRRTPSQEVRRRR